MCYGQKLAPLSESHLTTRQVKRKAASFEWRIVVAPRGRRSDKAELLEVVPVLHFEAVFVNKEAGRLIQPRVNDLGFTNTRSKAHSWHHLPVEATMARSLRGIAPTRNMYPGAVTGPVEA